MNDERIKPFGKVDGYKLFFENLKAYLALFSGPGRMTNEVETAEFWGMLALLRDVEAAADSPEGVEVVKLDTRPLNVNDGATVDPDPFYGCGCGDCYYCC